MALLRGTYQLEELVSSKRGVYFSVTSSVTPKANMKALLLPVVLLWVLWSVAQAQGEVTAVKLCGREFIRAVVYTCGGSRWRRIVEERELKGVEDTEDQNSLGLFGDSLGMDRAQRDLNQMLTTVCCQMGCRKSDLAFLC
ncbi:relaxin-3-like isoform X1 [Anguilla rostrata]|uniref:relaxin-3-like isoform X1 n=1 Tax=Anguilla anguilla TaxID=7936 RepID=UPI0015B13777|nr:relaxin-3-like isoform X1 [Anguilla anguilla]